MSIRDALVAGVKAADGVTKSVQPIVAYEQVLSVDEFGAFTYSAPRLMHAVVDFKETPVRTREGVLTASRATLTLLSVLEVVMATGGEGVKANDRFTLSDGSIGLALDIGGTVDPSTSHPFATTVMLG